MKIILATFIFISASLWAKDPYAIVEYKGNSYEAVIIQEIENGEQSKLLDFYEGLTLAEKTIPWEKGIAKSKRFLNSAAEFELTCTVLEYSHTAEAYATCKFTVPNTYGQSYTATYVGGSHPLISLAFQNIYAQEVYNFMPKDSDGFVDFTLGRIFEVIGGRDHLVLAVAEPI